jgi:hypothetical protein
LIELEKALFLAVNRDVAEYIRIPHMNVRNPADRLRSLQPRFAVGAVHWLGIFDDRMS